MSVPRLRFHNRSVYAEDYLAKDGLIISFVFGGYEYHGMHEDDVWAQEWFKRGCCSEQINPEQSHEFAVALLFGEI